MSNLIPYKIFPNVQNPEILNFITDKDILYAAYFVDANVYLPNKPYSNNLRLFGFFNNAASGRNEHDPRIRETILKIVLDEFQQTNTILVFVCSQ